MSKGQTVWRFPVLFMLIGVISAVLGIVNFRLVREAAPLLAGVPLNDSRQWPQVVFTVTLGLVFAVLAPLSYLLSRWFARPVQRTAQAMRWWSWPLLLTLPGLSAWLVIPQVVLWVAPDSGAQRFAPGGVILPTVTVVFLLMTLWPLVILVWVTLNRTTTLLVKASDWVQTPANKGQLFREGEQVLGLLGTLGGLLGALGTLLLPLQPMNYLLERQASIWKKTPLQELMEAQQYTLLPVLITGGIASGLCLWWLRQALRETLHVRDPQESRMFSLWRARGQSESNADSD